jgi:sugar phosphate isomerase/epimerase
MLIGCTAYSVRDYFKAKKIHCLNFAGIMSELGIEALEYHQMFFESWESDYLAQVRKSAQDVRLPIVCLGCAGGFCQDDPAARREDIEVIRDRLIAASALGAQCIRVQLGRTGDDERDEAVGIPRCIEALRELVPTAKERNVRIALENHGGVASRANWILRVVLGTDPDWVGACPDLGNFPREVRYRELARLLPYAFHVHAKSLHFHANGEERDTDFGRVIRMAEDCDCPAVFSIEYEGPGDQIAGVLRTKELIEKYRSSAL